MAVKDPSERIGYLIWQLSQAYAQRLERVLRPLGLTQAQFSALVRLSRDGAMSSAELARRCGVTAQSMGAGLRSLVERGLVERRPHPTHGKIIEMCVTPAGEALALRGETALEPCEQETLQPFLPREREQVRAHLRRMLGALNAPALGPDDRDQHGGT
ncbi:MarR family transcriptional regulator [Streptomyces sp. NBC_01275]|uniref:MarR family winged helix-turn-helix transcriptional regulator n=1 Tax=Streptomyces sp. NBC_01275 TaxID=2903807 RepID=UPI00225BB6B9|nr:MarR family transcriptional regulator [Streptomyces sp. NBC_01275]MCX4766783.1 MarR family transcriptional regulator [Streptomyces sp. NBC_01275]